MAHLLPKRCYGKRFSKLLAVPKLKLFKTLKVAKIVAEHNIYRPSLISELAVRLIVVSVFREMTVNSTGINLTE